MASYLDMHVYKLRNGNSGCLWRLMNAEIGSNWKYYIASCMFLTVCTIAHPLKKMLWYFKLYENNLIHICSCLRKFMEYDRNLEAKSSQLTNFSPSLVWDYFLCSICLTPFLPDNSFIEAAKIWKGTQWGEQKWIKTSDN